MTLWQQAGNSSLVSVAVGTGECCSAVGAYALVVFTRQASSGAQAEVEHTRG